MRGLRVKHGPITIDRKQELGSTVYYVSSNQGEERTTDLTAALRRHGLHQGDIGVVIQKVHQWGRFVAGTDRDPRDRQMGLFD